jgi:hypothetical protein
VLRVLLAVLRFLRAFLFSCAKQNTFRKAGCCVSKSFARAALEPATVPFSPAFFLCVPRDASIN